MARLGAWAALALGTLYLVFFGGGWQGIYNSALRSISTVVIAIAVLIWFAVAWRRPEWRPKSAFLPAIVACLASLAITTARSRYPRLGVEYLADAVVLAALYLVLVRILASPWFRARMATLATALAIVIGGLFLALTVGHWITWWGLVGRITVPPLRPDFESLTFGNPAAVMTMSVLLTSVAVASIGVGSRGRVVTSAVLVLLAGIATFLSGSRAGWIAAAAALVVVVIAWLVAADGRSQARSMVRTFVSTVAGRIATAGLVVAASAATIVLGPAILLRTGAGGEDLRIGYLTAALRMFQESPLFGTGAGTWVAQRIVYTEPPTTDYYIPHAHNVYVQTLAEQGLVGALAGLVLVVSILALIGRTARDRGQRAWVLAAIFSTAYFAAHHLFDFYLNFPSVMFAAALPIAWLDATNEPPQVSRVPAIGWLPAALAVLVAVGFMWSVEGPAASHGEATALANKGEWPAAIGPAKDAVDEDPDIPAYQVTYGLALAHTGMHPEAVAAFRRAATVDGLPETWLNIAAEEQILGHASDAVSAWDQAMRLGYQRPAVAFAAGELALTLGEEARAVEALSAAVATVPSLAADPWWSGEPEREAIFELVVDAAIERAPASFDWEIALMAGQPDRAVELANEAGAGADFARTVIEAWSNTPAMTDDDARQAIIQRCNERPLDATPLGWCARLAARAGETDEAVRYRKWAFTLLADEMRSAELRVSTEPMIGRTSQGAIAEFYGTYTYRRPTPWDLLVPSLPHLTFK